MDISTTITFQPGDTVANITLRTINDENYEGSEGLTVVLENPSGNTQVGVGTADVTILDDDCKHYKEFMKHDINNNNPTDSKSNTEALK